MSMALTWWRGACIYQVYPRSFYDSNDDGIGDLQGIIEKLEYIADLGVDGLWISPFFTSPMVDFGYDVANYIEVDPIFGTLDDFKALVDKAHALDLKVIIDQVYSHSSNKHKWFEQSRLNNVNEKADWYVWADPKPDGMPPNNWQSIFGGSSWSWDNQRKQYYLHNFLPEQPDLNLHNLDVQEALLSIATFWLDLGVDGFRLDAINYGMHQLALTDNPVNKIEDPAMYRPYHMQHHIYNLSQPKLTEFLIKLKSIFEAFGTIFTVAEVGGVNPVPTMKEYTKGEDRLSSAYSFEFLSANRINKQQIIDSLANWSNDHDNGWPSWAFSNHDAARVVSRWPINVDVPTRAKLYLSVLLALRGNIFIYQGEELGLVQSDVPFEKLQDPEAITNWPDNLGRDGSRTPMPWNDTLSNLGFSNSEPWLPVEKTHTSQSINIQIKDPDSPLNFSKILLKLRKSSLALRVGDIHVIEVHTDLLVFLRKHEGEIMLCIFNLTGHTLVGVECLFAKQGIELHAGKLKVSVNSDQHNLFINDTINAYSAVYIDI